MEMCRACMSAEKEMLPFDEMFITRYNLVTNLNIAMMDGMPQCICSNCLETVNLFIEFREKSLSSETKLKEILFSDLKAEECSDYNNDISKDNIIKLEIKDEFKTDDTVSDGEYEYLDYGYLQDVASIEIKPRKCKNNAPVEVKSEKKLNRLTKRDDENLLYCGICIKTFIAHDELTRHLEGHRGDKHCQKCAETFESWSQLLGHRLAHIPKKQKRCHICLKRFVSADYLEYHYRNQHCPEEGTKLRCKQCNSFYDTPRKLKKHTRSIHGEKKYVCDHCSKRFIGKSTLRVHMANHIVKKSYVCDECGFSSRFVSGLRDHKIRKHTATKVCCKECQRPFPNQETYEKHTCRIKVVMCPICGIQFGRNMKLSRHMNVHTNIQKYECDRCPAKFKTKGSLVHHQNRHDGNRTKHCEYCPAKFYTGSSLIKHRRIHTGEKPYVCKVCGKGFTGGHNLKVHMQVHGEYLINKRNKEQDVKDVISIC